jgi:hypothetical protein
VDDGPLGLGELYALGVEFAATGVSEGAAGGAPLFALVAAALGDAAAWTMNRLPSAARIACWALG